MAFIVDDIISVKHKKIAWLLVISLKSNYNSSAAKIKSAMIVIKLRQKGFACGDPELREIIGYIRRNDLCNPGFILSDNEGYWYSEDAGEMQHVWQSQYGRAIEIIKNFSPLHKRYKHLINEQDSIFKIV